MESAEKQIAATTKELSIVEIMLTEERTRLVRFCMRMTGRSDVAEDLAPDHRYSRHKYLSGYNAVESGYRGLSAFWL